MITREGVSLASLTTLRVGGAATRVIRAENESEVREAIAQAIDAGLPWYPLGGGSNLLAPDAGYAGVIIEVALPRLAYTDEGGEVVVVAEAGVSWDALVMDAAERGLWGIENLAGIPGTVGAAPIQNIGAYGTELRDTLVWVEVLDSESGEVRRLSKEECRLGYRDSRFKKEPGMIVLRVALSLLPQGIPQLTYKDLSRALENGVPLTTPREIGGAVRHIRAQKFPDLNKEGTAGSFFKNPTVTKEVFDALLLRYPELPGFETKSGIKLSLAWILDHVLSLKGLEVGGARLFEAQPLVIATRAGATSHDVDTLADTVFARVKDVTGIEIEREVRSLK